MGWQLRIECLSAVCPGSGLGHPGQVDRDIVLDSFGLPYIPGKRLKAMLSEAYQEVSLYKKGGTGPEEIFGKPGDDKPGPFSIRRAEVSGADQIRAWLDHAKTPLVRQDVVDSFTEIRWQTAMDREFGAPKEDTLRTTRVLRKGLVFSAPLEGVPPFESAIRDAARALQFMGTGRTRGLGHVRCMLEQTTGAAVGQSVSSPVDPANGCLGISIRLEGPAIFPSLGGDPNTVLTDDCVPGSALHGLLAQRYIHKYGDDARFYEMFFSDRVRFLPGHPRIGARLDKVRSRPVPTSLRQRKSYGDYIDVTDELPTEPVRRVTGWCRLSGTKWEHGHVRKQLKYHNARAADQRIGRAVGEKINEFPGLTSSQAGAFFTYEALVEGQKFDAEIRGSDGDLKLLRDLVADGEKILLGRSRNAEYGGAVWRWQSPQETAAVPEIDDSCPQIIVTLLSDLIGVNDNGHPAPVFPFAELASELGVELKLNEVRAFTRTGWQAGYMAHQRLPKQQMPVLTAGSVFQVPFVPPAKPNFGKALGRSYGLRVSEGFGQIALSLQAEVTDPKPAEPAPRLVAPPIVQDSPERRLAIQVFQSQVERLARRLALDLANAADKDQLSKISNSVLSRVLLLLERPTLDETRRELDTFRQPAQDQLKRLWVRGVLDKSGEPPKNRTLHDFLLGVCRDYSRVYAWITQQVYGRDGAHWIDAFLGGAPKAPDGRTEVVVRLFLRQYIRALLWKKRPSKTSAKGARNNG